MPMSRQLLDVVSDEELADMIGQLVDFETTGILQDGTVRDLIRNDAEVTGSGFSMMMVGTCYNIFRQAAFRWRGR